jgi:hypothetical protein
MQTTTVTLNHPLYGAHEVDEIHATLLQPAWQLGLLVLPPVAPPSGGRVSLHFPDKAALESFMNKVADHLTPNPLDRARHPIYAEMENLDGSGEWFCVVRISDWKKPGEPWGRATQAADFTAMLVLGFPRDHLSEVVAALTRAAQKAVVEVVPPGNYRPSSFRADC